MLTDEQILQIAENHMIFSRFYEREAIVKLVREAIEAACKQSLQVEREKAYDALSPDGCVSFVDRQIKMENEQSSNPLQLDKDKK